MTAVGFDCHDCGEDTQVLREYYVVRHDLWDDVAGDSARKGMLCIGCFEARLGRRLTPGDFHDCGVNQWTWGMSDRLLDRLGRERGDITEDAFMMALLASLDADAPVPVTDRFRDAVRSFVGEIPDGVMVKFELVDHEDDAS